MKIIQKLHHYNYLSSIKYQVAREKIEKLLKLSNDTDLINDSRFALIKDELKAQLFDVAKVKTKLNKKKSVSDEMVTRLTSEYQVLKNAFTPVDEKAYFELTQKREEISKKEYEHSADYKSIMAKMDEFNKVVAESQIAMNTNKKKYDLLVLEINNTNMNIKHYNSELTTLRDTFVSVKNSSRKCPNCNFELDKESINKRLQEINQKGQSINETIKQLQEKLNSLDLFYFKSSK